MHICFSGTVLKPMKCPVDSGQSSRETFWRLCVVFGMLFPMLLFLSVFLFLFVCLFNIRKVSPIRLEIILCKYCFFTVSTHWILSCLAVPMDDNFNISDFVFGETQVNKTMFTDQLYPKQ